MPMIAPCRKMFSRPVRSRMKPGGDLDERADAPATTGSTAVGPQDSGQHLQRRGLARAVRADDAERFARLDFERDVAHRPELLASSSVGWRLPLERRRDQRRHEIAQAVEPLAAAEFLPDVVEEDRRPRATKRSPRTGTRPDETSASRQPAVTTANAPATAKRHERWQLAAQDHRAIAVDDRRHRIQLERARPACRRPDRSDTRPMSRTSRP